MFYINIISQAIKHIICGGKMKSGPNTPPGFRSKLSKAQSKANLLNTTPGLSPTFYIFSKTSKTSFRIPDDEQVFKIGRSEECDIIIDDSMISNVQVSVVKLGNYCYFMDCGNEDCVSFNGIGNRQVAVSSECRMIIKVGNTWIVYIGIDSKDYEDERDTFILKRSLIMGKKLESKTQAQLLIKSSFGETTTDSAPVLIGSHKSCDYKISGEGIEPFHFLIYFNPSGLFVEDLTRGRPGIKVNAMNCIGARPINEDLTINIGKLEIFLYVYGNVLDRCKHLFKDLNTKPELAITDLHAQNAIPITLAKSKGRISIGRSPECDIELDDPSVSWEHAFMQIKEKCFYVADNNSSNKCFLNCEQVDKAKVQPGDIIEFGHRCYLVHYAC
jgi:pSer/pThr/pTyr-binding forkhead associated (FHA) protein